MSHKLIVLLLSITSFAIFQDHFVYKKGNQELNLNLENDLDYLKWSELSVIKLSTRNIDPKNLSMSAPGLKLIKSATDDNPESLWQIKPEKNLIKNDTLKLNIRVKEGKDSWWSHQFKIFIKE